MRKDKSWWAIFRSMKTGLYLVLAICMASMAGTIVPQQQMDESGGWLKQFLQLSDLYHSWWYIALLGLLILNLMACSFYRIKTIQAALKKPKRLLEREEIVRLKAQITFTVTGELDEVKNRIMDMLTGHRYEIWSDMSAGRLRIGAQHGRFGVLGSFITHIGLVIIIAGVLTGAVFGYQGTIDVPVGTTFSLADITGLNPKTVKHDLQIMVEKFWVERYTNGSPSDYYSRLTVIENHKPVQTSVIAVNHPLNYKGIKFYQARYGDAIEIQVNGPDGRTVGRGVVREGDSFSVPDTSFKILVYRYISAAEKVSDISSNTQLNNPRVVYILFKGSQHMGMDAGQLDSPISLGDQGYTFKFTGIIPYTGLVVKKDPGVSLIWLGCIFMLLGMGIAFFMQPRYLWLAVEQQGKLVLVSIGGKTNNNQLALKEHINNIASDMHGLIIRGT